MNGAKRRRARDWPPVARLAFRIAGTVVLLGVLAVLGLMTLPRVLGYQTLLVRSGSMTGTADTGSVVFARPLAASETRVGDVVLLQRHDGAGTPLAPALHRIVERNVDENGHIIVQTKGDANSTADPGPTELTGATVTPVLVIPHIGYAVAVLQTPLGWLGLVVFPTVILTAIWLYRLWNTEPGAPVPAVAGRPPHPAPTGLRPARRTRRHRRQAIRGIALALPLLLLPHGAAGTDVLGVLSNSTTVSSNTFTTAAVFSSCSTKTPVYLNSFERGPGTSAFGNFDTGSASGGTVDVDSAVARHGAYSLQVAKTATGTTYIQKTFNAGAGQVVARFGMRLSSLPAANVVQLASVRPNAGNDLNVRYTAATQTLDVGFGTAVGSTASTPVSAGAWSLIEVKVDFSTNPRVAEWRLNGTVIGTVSSAETASTANSWRAGSTTSADLFTTNYDDLILSTTVGDYPFGDGAGGLLLPNGMGTSGGAANFENDDTTAIDSTTYQRLDEVPMNSTADYVTQIAVSTSSYVEVTMSDTGSTATCFNGMIGVAKLHSGSGGTTNSARSSVFSSSTESVVSSGDTSTNAGEFRTAMVTPSSAPWGKAQVDALVFRFGYAGDVAPKPNWNALAIEYDAPA